LYVAVGVVLHGWLRGLPCRAGLLRGRLLARRTEERRHNHEQCRTQINERLEVLLQDAFGQFQVASQRWLGLRLCVGSKGVFDHEGDPLRVNSIRFLPSSTYPLSMIFGMMYVPSRR